MKTKDKGETLAERIEEMLEKGQAAYLHDALEAALTEYRNPSPVMVPLGPEDVPPLREGGEMSEKIQYCICPKCRDKDRRKLPARCRVCATEMNLPNRRKQAKHSCRKRTIEGTNKPQENPQNTAQTETA